MTLEDKLRLISDKELENITIKKISTAEVGRSYDRTYFMDDFKKSSKQETTCPHCKRSGKGNSFKGRHFDKCEFKGFDMDKVDELLKTSRMKILSKELGISFQMLKAYSKDKGLYNPHSPKGGNHFDVCPHCDTKGLYKDRHFDNCTFKGVDLELVKKELLSGTLPSKVSDMFGLHIRVFEGWRKRNGFIIKK